MAGGGDGRVAELEEMEASVARWVLAAVRWRRVHRGDVATNPTGCKVEANTSAHGLHVF